MTTFPITYIAVIIWLLLITYQDNNYWIRFFAKAFGVLFGIWLAINSFNGEQWLFVDGSGNLTLTQFKDGFQLPLSLIVVGLSLILLMMLGESAIAKDWEKQDIKKNE